MGIGLAALWVKEVSRKGIIEALRARRCYGTSGDRIFVDFKVNNALMGETIKSNGTPNIEIQAKGENLLKKIELLRNSRVIKSWIPDDSAGTFSVQYADNDYKNEKEVLYYYVRVTQTDEHLAWSSPVFLQLT